MEIDRRSLMKGLLASGALLALGPTSWTFADQPTKSPKRCLLFLGDSAVDNAFAEGVRAACRDMGVDEPLTVRVTGGVLSHPDQLVEWLERAGGARWIAAMDDASAAVFQELARTAGGRLLSAGCHASVHDDACPFRHAWLSASAAQGVSGLLATQLVGAHASFTITESFLSSAHTVNEMTGWAAPGFSSYRSAEPEVMHLHCSGLSLSEGGRLLGVAGPEDWTPIPPHARRRDTAAGHGDHWVEAVGRAVAASALGVDRVLESCVSRAFIHRAGRSERMQPSARFVTFVMDL